jgi:hypothetical protein
MDLGLVFDSDKVTDMDMVVPIVEVQHNWESDSDVGYLQTEMYTLTNKIIAEPITSIYIYVYI